MRNLIQIHNEKLHSKGVKVTAVGEYITKGNTQQNYLCDQGHEFTSCRTYMIRSAKGCPTCNNGNTRWNHKKYKQKLLEIQSVLTPLEEFKGVEYKIDHVCNNGHTRNVTPSSVIRGSGCAVCSGVIKKTTEQYEKELWEKCIPYTICEEYDGVMKKADHKCLECGHVWKVKPHDILNGNGCPICAKTGFKPNKPAILYYARVWDENTTLYKIGVTNKPKAENRLRFCGKKYKLLMERKFDTGKEALAAEAMILEEYADMKVYAPQFMPNGGYTELFSHDILLLEK